MSTIEVGLTPAPLSIRNSLFVVTAVFPVVLSATEPPPEKLKDMVVTANLVPVQRSQVGSAVTVITAADIEKQQITYVSDILRTVPGLAVNQSGGGFGSLTQVRIRGAEGNQTLVRLNGIEMNDPSGGSEYNFGNMLAENIERIEIIRGSQSSLFGSDAIGGVINIITKKGSRGLQLNANAEGGAFGTYKVGAGVNGGWKDTLEYSFQATQFESSGISIAESGSEKDGNRNLTLDGSVSVRPMKNLTLGVTGRRVRSNTDTDGFQGGAGSVDANNKTITLQNYGRAFSKLTLFDNSDGFKWEHLLSAGYSESRRDNYRNNLYSSKSNGRNVKYAYQTNLIADFSGSAQSRHVLTFLIEHEKDTVNFLSSFSRVDRNIETTSYVGEYQLSLFDRLSVTGSVRYDNNDNLFNNATTYRGTFSYLLKETGSRLHASYGTGVKNPTLFELFGFSANFQGNPNLNTEKNRSWDVGMEQQFLSGKISLDATYYNNRIGNLIVGSGNTAVNQKGRSQIEGIEVALKAEIIQGLDFSSSYTWNSTQDASGRRLVRRPEHIASANLNYRFEAFGKPGNINLGVKYNGKQTDFAFDSSFNRSIVVLDDYTLVNVAASYQVFKSVELFARVENLLDEQYQEVYTFAAKGIAGYGGIRVSLDPL